MIIRKILHVFHKWSQNALVNELNFRFEIAFESDCCCERSIFPQKIILQDLQKVVQVTAVSSLSIVHTT